MLVGGDDGLDGQIELLGEFMVTCVVRWHRHHSSLSHTPAFKRKTHTHTHDTHTAHTRHTTLPITSP